MGAVLSVASSAWEQPAPAPLAGQHSVEICRQLGLSPERIEALLASGVIA
jgi:crotonobetainyl-CoA:carnitine CoA-transferase CaiB-like acyl-CoA transferase